MRSLFRLYLLLFAQIEDFGQSKQVDCFLGVSMETLVVMEEDTKEVVFYCPTKAIIGWTSQNNRSALKLRFTGTY